MFSCELFSKKICFPILDFIVCLWWPSRNSQIWLTFKCRDAIDAAVKYKDNPTDIDDQILEELDNFHFDPRGDDKENSETKESDKENEGK